MSRETSQWLNNYCLIGFTSKRGNAWHYRSSDQGVEPNHYPMEIPMDDVLRRLFFWEPVEGTVESRIKLADNGVETIIDKTRKSIVRPRTRQFGPPKIFGEFSTDFQVHSFREWLLTKVANFLDSDLAIGSAGLLKDGAQAWVQVELPENVVTPEGVEFRPFISAATSLDGSLATTYKRGNDLIVCDNTMHAALFGSDMRIKIKHTKNSKARLNTVRDALGIVYEEAEAFAAEISELCSTDVTNKEWFAFLDAYSPLPDVPGDDAPAGVKRAFTTADKKRDRLSSLYFNDPRVEQWSGTAFGVLQAANTYMTHESLIRSGTNRIERNRTRALKGDINTADAEVLNTLARVLAH